MANQLVLIFILLLNGFAGYGQQKIIKVAVSEDSEYIVRGINKKYKASTGIVIEYIFGHSDSLAGRIQRGENFDLFISENESSYQRLSTSNLLSGTVWLKVILSFLAGVYNTIFAFWLLTSPETLFGLIDEPVPLPEFLILPLTIGILIFGAANFYGAFKPGNAWYYISWSLLAKTVTPVVVIFLIITIDWPASLLLMVFFNDVVWWIPFYKFLRKDAISRAI